jgi:two-component system LytT family sensor kinase
MRRFEGVARAYGISIAVWSLLSIFMGLQYLNLDRALHIRASWLDVLEIAEARCLAFALLTPPIFYLVHRHVGSGRDALRGSWIWVLGFAPFLVSFAALRLLLWPPWDEALQGFVPRSPQQFAHLLRDDIGDMLTAYVAIVVSAHAAEYFRRSRRHEVEKYQIEQALATSELQALKTQLHPHFLFNTLNGIATLIRGDGERARAMLVKLSSLLRTALEHDSASLIPLHEELKFVREYLDLEKMRLGPRLEIVWSIDPDAAGLLVPQLILQPLVENAIRHGIAPSREGGWLEIGATRSSGTLEIRVRNSVAGRAFRGTGLGLRNTLARLKYLYSGDARFSFSAGEGGTASATLVLPSLASGEHWGKQEMGGTQRR